MRAGGVRALVQSDATQRRQAGAGGAGQGAVGPVERPGHDEAVGAGERGPISERQAGESEGCGAAREAEVGDAAAPALVVGNEGEAAHAGDGAGELLGGQKREWITVAVWAL